MDVGFEKEGLDCSSESGRIAISDLQVTEMKDVSGVPSPDALRVTDTSVVGSANNKEEVVDEAMTVNEPLDINIPANVSRKGLKATIDVLQKEMGSDNPEPLLENGAPLDKSVSSCVVQIEEHTQTDVGGMNAFYAQKSLKPVVVLEEGVTAHEHYSSDHGSYILLADAGAQTVPVGHSTFHKATQMPEMSYNPYTNKNVLKQPAGQSELAPGTPADVAVTVTQATSDEPTAADVVNKLHKATQYPDKEYADPGHPPAPAIVWPDPQQLLLQQQQQQQQLLLQQQLTLQQQQLQQQYMSYYYVDPSTGLPITTGVQPQQLTAEQQCLLGQQQQWPLAQQQNFVQQPQYQQYPGGYEQPQ